MSEAQDQGKPIKEWLKSMESGAEGADREALQVLKRMGPAAVPDLIQALKDQDWQVRNQAAVALGVIGPEAKTAVPALIDALQAEDKYLRSHAATALGQIGREAGAAVPALTSALQDKEEDVGSASSGLGPGRAARG
jgi:HEAT repeat protein